MNMLLDRSYDPKTLFYEYSIITTEGEKWTGYAKEIDSYAKPLFMVKWQDKEICRLEDDNLIRPWLTILSFIFPSLRHTYTLKMNGLRQGDNFLSSNGTFYSIKIDGDTYSVKGHSHCIVTLWKNECQAGLLKRVKAPPDKGFEAIEVLYDKCIPTYLSLLLSVFGWETYVGRINGNRTITTISLSNQPYDIHWQPSE